MGAGAVGEELRGSPRCSRPPSSPAASRPRSEGVGRAAALAPGTQGPVRDCQSSRSRDRVGGSLAAMPRGRRRGGGLTSEARGSPTPRRPCRSRWGPRRAPVPRGCVCRGREAGTGRRGAVTCVPWAPRLCGPWGASPRPRRPLRGELPEPLTCRLVSFLGFYLGTLHAHTRTHTSIIYIYGVVLYSFMFESLSTEAALGFSGELSGRICGAGGPLSLLLSHLQTHPGKCSRCVTMARPLTSLAPGRLM